jgi:hypothetical protein
VEKPSRYGKRLKELILKYPNYQLINVLWTNEWLANGNPAKILSREPIIMSKLYSGRSAIHAIERYFGLILAIFEVGLELDLNKIEAFNSVIYDFDLSETDEDALEFLISVLKINYLLALFTISDK